VITNAPAAAAPIAKHFARSSPITLIRVPTPFTENLKSGMVPRSGVAKIPQRKNKRASQEPTVNGRENSLHLGEEHPQAIQAPMPAMVAICADAARGMTIIGHDLGYSIGNLPSAALRAP
jgi:hypothetical protein